MNITDEMVERAAKALAAAYDDRYGAFMGLTAAKDMARAALAAALGHVETEPLTEISARCEECGGQWFWPLDDRQELILTTCHEHSDPPEPLEDVLGGAWCKITVLPGITVHIEYEVQEGNDFDTAHVHATAETFSDAIRAAVANAKGGEG